MSRCGKWLNDSVEDLRAPAPSNPVTTFVQVMSPLLHSLATRFALGRLGLRPWMVRARFGFHDGRSNGGLSMWVGAPRGALIDVDNDHPVWYWLDASTSFSPSGLEEEKALHRADRDPSVASHSDFLIYKPCLTTYGGGEVLNTLLSNDPARATREMAFDRNLSCLTAFESCTELCELAPRAWAQFVADGAHGCNMGEEALTRARRACGDWAGQVGKPSN